MTEEVVIEFEYKAREAFKEFHKRTQRWAVLVSIEGLVRR